MSDKFDFRGLGTGDREQSGYLLIHHPFFFFFFKKKESCLRQNYFRINDDIMFLLREKGKDDYLKKSGFIL